MAAHFGSENSVTRSKSLYLDADELFSAGEHQAAASRLFPRTSFRLTNLASSSIAIPLPAFTAYFDKLDPSLSRMLRHPQSSCL
jgi:hypothetical protein